MIMRAHGSFVGGCIGQGIIWSPPGLIYEFRQEVGQTAGKRGDSEMRWSHGVLIAAMGMAGFVNLAARADEDPVELKNVPAVVRESADKAIPGAKWAEATKEFDDGETTYTLNGADTKGREVNVSLSKDGQVELVETVLSVTDLPKMVVDILKTLPQVKWTDATETVEDGITTYEVSGSDLRDRESSAKITGDAGESTLRTELEINEVPAVVSDALKARFPEFHPESIMSVTENGKLTGYAFLKGEADDEEMEVFVSVDGKIVKVDDDD